MHRGLERQIARAAGKADLDVWLHARRSCTTRATALPRFATGMGFRSGSLRVAAATGFSRGVRTRTPSAPNGTHTLSAGEWIGAHVAETMREGTGSRLHASGG